MVEPWLLVYCLFVGRSILVATEIITLSGMDVCNETVVLGITHPASVIDFRVSSLYLESVSHVCSFRVETTNTPYIGVKFLSTLFDVSNSNDTDCSFELSITGKHMEQLHFNTFPENEVNINTYGYVVIKIKLNACMLTNFNNASIFSVLVFKYGDIVCYTDEIHCKNSSRCVNSVLACSKMYDFCMNNFQNYCQKSSSIDLSDDSRYKRNKRTGPPSIPGMILGIASLIALTSFCIYYFLCRKQPCCKRIKQKISCRLSLCENCNRRNTERPLANAHYIHQSDQVYLQYTCFREPPPSYSELHPSYDGQTENTNPSVDTGCNVQNIPPPLYSSENTIELEHTTDNFPPPYSTLPPNYGGLQHM